MGDDIRDKVEQLVKNIVSCTRVYSMYGKEHKILHEALFNLQAIIDGLLSARAEITVGIIGNEIAFEKEPFYDTSASAGNFIEHLKKIGVLKITFLKGLSSRETENFIGCLSEFLSFSGQTPQDFGKKIEEKAITHILTGQIAASENKEITAFNAEDINVLVRKNYSEGVKTLTEAVEDFKKNHVLPVDSIRRLAASIMSDVFRNKNLLLILTAVKSHDEGIFVNSLNVAIFTLLQAESLGLDQKYLNDIGVAALLHDVGKLSSSGDFSKNKNNRTKEEEEQKARREPVDGAKALLETKGLSSLAAISAFERYMRYDLSGYPERLYGEKLNFVSMMIAISDYYDTLRRKSSVQDEHAPEKVYEEMMQFSGKYFHPDLLNNFFSVIGVYPPGTLVELDTGEIGLVVKESVLDKRRPQVEILYNEDGRKDEFSKIANLLERAKGKYKRTIVRSLEISDQYEIPEKYL